MKKLLFIGFVALCASCDSDLPKEPVAPPESQEGIVQLLTRVDGDDIASEVNAGLYMVNYLNDEKDDLLATANYVNNQLLTFSDNMWSTSTPIYWCDATTPADFYAYAPYQSDVADARALSFNIQKNQATADLVAQSDFLWGTIQGQSPTESSFDLTLSHLMSQLTVVVTASDDLAQSLKAEDVTVTIGGTKTSAKIDLATGTIIPDGDVEEVACCNNGDLSYTAILVPQQVPFSNLIQIVWDGNPYTVQNAFKLEPKKKYSLSVKLKKTESGFDIGIDGWDIIGEDFGGIVGG